MFMPDTAKWSFNFEYKFRKDAEVRNAAFTDQHLRIHLSLKAWVQINSKSKRLIGLFTL